ncbi:gp53-like domain-containing protein [Pseudomonas atacamensis]|uniref:gp53-like domain-containing protein n=1 Tax=Pseudomonas atacamensis TaxID=2565368 RepID=UPI0019D1126E|nr:hypothetical protein [Pseudomonas atacamensis]QSL90426.1 hypothetical protein JWU58_26680 [Pseudomonas atacamensis]
MSRASVLALNDQLVQDYVLQFKERPNGPTQPVGTADDSLASTAFVARAQGNFSGQTNITTATAVIAPTMAGRRIVASVPGTLTLSQWNLNTAGSKFYIQNVSGGEIVVSRWGTDVIVALSKTLNSITIPSGSNAVITCGESTWVLEEGVAALKYSTEFTLSALTNGYQKLPSGLIEQWGAVTVQDNGEQTVVLPTAFPNGILGLLASVPNSAAAGAAEFCLAGARKNGTSLSTIFVNANSGPTVSVNPIVYWRVWGY